jgi:hypothetical protein
MMGLISTIALLAPVITILSLRLAGYKSFPALLAYFLVVFSYNMLTWDFIHLNKDFIYYFGVLNNFLDAPLMLIFMSYFSQTASFRKKMFIAVPILIVFDIVIIILNGFNIESATIALGPGLAIIMVYAILFFIRQAKLTIIHQKALGKACMVAALLFAYGGYTFIYIVYYLMKTPHKADTYVVYYLITFCSSLILATGIYLEKRRVNVLAEIKTTREELKMIYGGVERAATSN